MENWIFIYTLARERSAEAVAHANAMRTLDGVFTENRRNPRRRRFMRKPGHVMLRRGLGRIVVVLRSRRLELSISVVRVRAGCVGEGRGQSGPG